MPVYQVTSSPKQIVWKGDPSSVVFNRDPSRQVFWGKTQSEANRADASILDPATHIIASGKDDIWVAASSTPPSIIVDVIEGATSRGGSIFSGPSAEVTTPVLVPPFNTNIAAGATLHVASPVGVHQPIASYLSLTATMYAQSVAAPGNAPYHRLRMSWSNSNDNFDPQLVEDWVLATGPVSFTNNYRHDCTFTTFCDTLDVYVTNYDTVAMLYTCGMFGSIRTHPTEIRGRYPDDAGTSANPTAEARGLNTDNVLLSFSQGAIAAGNTGAAVLIPFLSGDVEISGLLAGEAAAGQVLVRVQPQPSAAGAIAGTAITGQKVFWTTKPGILSNTGFKLPRRVCTVQVDNTNGTAPVTPSLMIVESGAGH